MGGILRLMSMIRRLLDLQLLCTLDKECGKGKKGGVFAAESPSFSVDNAGLESPYGRKELRYVPYDKKVRCFGRERERR